MCHTYGGSIWVLYPQVGDSVEARYTADGKWYPATIIQAIHGGYEIARYGCPQKEVLTSKDVEPDRGWWE